MRWTRTPRRRPKEVVKDLTEIDRVRVTGVGGVGDQAGDDIIASFAAEECDHGAGVEDVIHRDLSSRRISRRLAAAKRALLVATERYFPLTAATAAERLGDFRRRLVEGVRRAEAIINQYSVQGRGVLGRSALSDRRWRIAETDVAGIAARCDQSTAR